MDPEKLKKLKAEREAALKKCREITDAAEKENRDLTADETETYNAQFASADSLSSRIKRAEKLAASERLLDEPAERRTTPDGPSGGPGAVDAQVGVPRLSDDPFGGYGERGFEGVPVERIERRAIGKCFGEFAADVAGANDRSRDNDRLTKWTAAVRAAGDGMSAYTGYEGGYLIPPQMAALVQRTSLETSVIRPRATVIPMSSNRVTFPFVNDTDHSGLTVFGGIAAYFKSEEAQFTSSKPTFGSFELALHKLTALAYVSNELLDFSPISLGTWLPEKLAQAIAWTEDTKFISGNGAAGEPRGILNQPCTISITKETGQLASTIVFQNIVKAYTRLWKAGGLNSVIWIANEDTRPQLSQMSIAVGTGGMPVFLPANGASGAPFETLYGRPIVFTEHAEALGTAGDIYAVNLSEYMIGDSAKFRSDRDMGLKFDYDQTAFRVVTYVGGGCPWSAAITPEHGDTKSPFVNIAVRS